MIRKSIMVACCMMMLTAAQAQTVEEQKKTIATVKRSSEYVYAEATCETADEAYKTAMANFRKKTNGRAGQPTRIQLKRGNMTRVFLYTRRSEQTAQGSMGTTPPNNTAARSGTQTTVIVKTAPSHTQVVSREPVNTQGNTPLNNNSRDAAIAELCSIQTLGELKTTLNRMQAESKVASYASYSKLATPENFILVIYDAQGTVKAVLSEGRERTNLKTKVTDSIRNYKGMGAVGVKLK